MKHPYCLSLCGVLCLFSPFAYSETRTGELAGGGTARRMLSPSGYTGAINTPNAHVQAWGVANLAWTNSNPEYARSVQQGSFGSLNAGVGLLPGLEVVGRLAFEGDLNCNGFTPSCPAGARDLSLSAKFQLPIHLNDHTHLAAGVTDFGGAATNFRQIYGVVTTEWRNLELSLGNSRSSSARALMHGTFGSVRYAFHPQLHGVAEHDTRESRAGLQYQFPLGDRSYLQTAYSRKWTHHAGQQANQLQLALVFPMGRSAPAPGQSLVNADPLNRPAAAPSLAVAAITAEPPATSLTSSSPWQSRAAASGVPTKATAQSMAHTLQTLGYANVQIQHWPASATQVGFWHVTAESRTHRQSQMDALGRAMAPWLAGVRQQTIAGSDLLAFTLSYQRQAVLHAMGQGACLAKWAQGATNSEWPACDRAEPITLSRTPIPEVQALHIQHAQDASVQNAHASAGAAWAPQLTLSPALRNTLGTEYGLFDYSLAAQVGAEVGLAPGLFWQAVYMVPVSHSDDYQKGKVFADARFAQHQWHSSQLTYWTPLPWGVSAQASIGQLAPGQTGAQWDALWMNNDGRWRVGASGARYRGDAYVREQLPLYAQVRYAIIPGAWHAEATAGQFMHGDRGYKLTSVHWSGDTRMALQFQKSGDARQPRMPSRSFASFSVSFPFGPQAAVPIGPVWLRAQDQWQWGVQTKVGERNNKLTQGYGDIARQRQGLWSDVTDHDRNGQADLQAQLPRLKTVLLMP